ncbi:MAG: agmatinase [Gammaproteobacteria bacterium]|nr:agmatinase [Gammaproteobacteria bacterium]
MATDGTSSGNAPPPHVEHEQGDLAFTRESPYGTLGEATFAGALSFCRRRYSKHTADADIAVVGVPFDLATTSRPGARLGPRAVRAASAMIAWCPPFGWGFDPFEDLHVVDFGDVQFDWGHPEGVPEQITAQFSQILATDTATLMIGGDHFATYPVLKAHVEKHGPLALVHFDAHSDTWRDEDERIDHGTMFFHAAQQGLIDVDHSVQVGIRTVNEESHGFEVLDAYRVRADGITRTIQNIRARVGNRPCYLTFDIDCLDPAYAPGTGTPVVGGLSTADAREIIRGLSGLQVRGMDLVEVAPAYDVSEITALAGATIALDLIALFASGRR